MEGLLAAVDVLRESLRSLRHEVESSERAKCLFDPSNPRYASANIWRTDIENLLNSSHHEREKMALIPLLMPPRYRDEVDPPVPDHQLFRGHCRRRYDKHKKELDPVLSRTFAYWHEDSYEREVLRPASTPTSTIHKWKETWQGNRDWRPWHMKESHGRHHRLFTDEQEAEIAEIICSRYVDKGLLFTRTTLKAMALEKWK
jgi:hypothetical protein